ncbi:hypothetical protein FOZ62_026522 [Perkinsus olseni]|uniref:C3H1-type domain-containing protein n=1 Tax=Perkinsus olseni TaxID=32597 RepID=A0A7J6Q7B4_PEROL|nr:hypothetical protein FOZ62_026522 [Perkinsus olseni]
MSSECTPISSTVATTLSGGESPVMNRQRTSSSGGISSSAGSSYGSRRGTFAKIRLCKFYEHGLCWHGDDCAYAHGDEELRRPPDLRKTKLCHQFRLGRCSQDSDCQYAHGRSELRCTPEVYKTSLCRFWLKGKCGAAENCRHAHGEADLRGGQTGASSPSATAPSVQSAVTLSLDGREVPPDSVGTDSDDSDKLTEKLYHLIDELATCPELKHMSTYLRSTSMV